jgi:hypothetical protein
MAQGGSVAGKKFPDLTGDGKVTKKDILKGRGVAGFKDGKEVDLDKLPRSMKKKTRTGLFSHSLDVKETRKPKTKKERAGETDIRTGLLSEEAQKELRAENKIKARTAEKEREKFEKKTQEKMGSFKDGGKVSRTAAMEDAYETKKKVKYARVPMEPVSGKEPNALEDAMRYERRREGDTKTYRNGGMVRGCKGVQVSGKGFKGTY